MKDGIDNINAVKQLLKSAADFFKSNQYGFNMAHGVLWSIQKVIGYADALFELHPFRVGDYVEMIDPPKISKDSGWRISKHHFTIGQRCEITGVDWREDSGFQVDIKFVDEYHVYSSSPTEERRIDIPTGDRAIYSGLAAKRFRKVEKISDAAVSREGDQVCRSGECNQYCN